MIKTFFLYIQTKFFLTQTFVSSLEIKSHRKYQQTDTLIVSEGFVDNKNTEYQQPSGEKTSE